MNALIDIALGNKKADLVLKNVNLVNVCSGEIYETDIAIAHGLIAGLGRYEGRMEIDAQDNYAVPGLIDGHTHIEMSMLSVREFAKAVVPRGTTAVVADPHEIANVLGIDGIRALLDDARTTTLKVFCMAPSCVPSTDPSLGLETSGATLDHTEIRKLLQMDGIIGLAEVMNYVGVIAKEEEVLEEIEIAKALKMPIDGHAPLLSGKELNAYVVSGAGSDHENTTYEESREKLRLGMRVMVREGSVAKNLKNIAPLLRTVDTRNCMLVTDGDRTPLDLKDEGYLDYVLRRAIEEGIDPVKAVQMCTINPAQWFKLDNIIGCIAPGKIADIVLLKNLETFEVEKVIVNGKPDFAQRAEYSFNYPHYRESVRIMRVKPDEFVIAQEGAIKARIIGLIEGELLTEELVEEISGIEIARDILEIGVLERHHYSGNMGLGFVKGFGLKTGAIASTIAHDSHNIVVIGTNEEDMALACNRLKAIGGGIVLCNGEEVTSELKLPIAGLMSDKGLDYVMRKQKEMDDSISEMGCKLPAPFIAMSFLALPVIPKLKITDKGLVDVAKREIVAVFL
uniref:Adenine deaminase n=1 Tax=Uncultured archaeon GZfos26G2 TaxID=3386331 RepID=Q649Z1_UNCAG|nr:adenine deaminase [uncultured archaeon GZfos33H6]